jgi:hypothetical protein
LSFYAAIRSFCIRTPYDFGLTSDQTPDGVPDPLTYYKDKDPEIKAIGVWDTVGKTQLPTNHKTDHT